MAAPMAGKFDGNLCDILQNVQQIDAFLDVIFEFLCRRTDFYKLMRHEHDTMGLPPGVAKKLVMKAFLKYEKVGQASQLPDSKINELGNPSCDVPSPISTVEIPSATQAEGTTHEALTNKEEHAEEDGKQEGSTTDRCDKQTGGDTSSMEGKQRNRAKEMITESDTYNGALRDNYAWSQTLTDVDLKVFVPETLQKAKDLIVDIKDDHIKVAVLGRHTGADEPQVLLDGKLTMKIRCDQSLWSLHPRNYVQLSLEKFKETWWQAAVVGEPPIDKKSINNVQNVSEMDEDAQQDYERVMFDMEQKRQGKPSSKELETHEILRKAWNVEGSPFKGTDFDPSSLNIST